MTGNVASGGSGRGSGEFVSNDSLSLSHPLDNDVDEDLNNGSSGNVDCRGDDDDDSVGSGDNSVSDSTGTPSSTGRTLTQEEETEIAKSESAAVFRLRLVVIFVLILSSAAVAFGVWKISSDAEQTEFENKYYDDSAKIFEAVSTNIDLTLGAIDSFAVEMVSLAKFANDSWPFVTVPDLAIKTAKLRSSANAALVQIYHNVSTPEERLEWEGYTAAHGSWVEESLEIQKNDRGYKGTLVENYTVPPYIPLFDGQGVRPYNSTGPFLPLWQSAPVVPQDTWPVFNFDVYSLGTISETFPQWAEEKGAFIGPVSNLNPDRNDFWTAWITNFVGDEDSPSEPFCDIYYPILESYADSVYNPEDPEEPVRGSISITYYFRDLIRNILPQGSDGIVTVIQNDCNQTFSYQINGPDTVYLGPDDMHDPDFDEFLQTVELVELDSFAAGEGSYSGLKLSEMGCQYTMHTYPSVTMQDAYTTNQPFIFTIVTVIIFFFTSSVFLFYDWLVERRQKKVLKSAMQTGAIVSSLFPKQVRDRLLKEEEKPKDGGQATKAKNSLASFLHDGSKPKETAAFDMLSGLDDRPIADLFPECTVMFADIAGFTAWSSTREPSQVFTLLEHIYGAFDRAADRRRVFKVETIGDSYVAACGLPDPRKDHAVVMSRFASDCREKFAVLTQSLETNLGPETGDLSMRFGLHSGPVTAGVLRGQKSRFQLFGDTVNTAARMESTGRSNLIQVSQVTADNLIRAGKELWLRARDEQVEAKGKGKMQTYWVEPKSRGSSVYSTPMFPSGASTAGSSYMSDNESTEGSLSPIQKLMGGKGKRMVDWNVEILSRFIRQIVARRNAQQKMLKKRKSTVNNQRKVQWKNGEKQVLDEVKEIIELPGFDNRINDEDIVFEPLADAVNNQLYDYVTKIAAMYHDNPFHCFDHASHVAMSVAKLMSRIMSSAPLQDGDVKFSLHDHTYGITSDPLTQFACLFSALIHDVDHPGVPNSQLVKENTEEAQRYKGRSVAEQNSVDLAWDLLLKPKYDDLRRSICETEEEMSRFRQLVVNSVMATDIMDKELKELRNGRWETAFDGSTRESERDHVNRKATIVIEHLIQASDVAHTMQHWHIYRKWNERLFGEMYLAYKEGRSEKDPSEFWYKGELGFFDFYIIPLAKKLSDCGVFGVSSDEYLNYAQKNREEWKDRGEEELRGMINRLKQKEDILNEGPAYPQVEYVDGTPMDMVVALKG